MSNTVTDLVTDRVKGNYPKSERYGWGDIGVHTTPMMIALNELHIPEYQRGEVSRQSTTKRASNYDMAAAGACVVGQRPDGSFWLVDGLQRALSLASRDQETHIPCMVFPSSGEEHEARVFERCNMNRKNVGAVHKYRVRVDGNQMPEKEIDDWLRENGMIVSDSRARNEIGFPTRLIQLWKVDKSKAQKALLITRKIGEGHLSNQIFQGINTLLRKNVDVAQYVEKIKQNGGELWLLREINTIAITSNSSKSYRVCAAGVLKAINYRKKNKIQINW